MTWLGVERQGLIAALKQKGEALALAAEALMSGKAQPTDDYALPTSDADEAPAVAAASALPPSVTQRDDSPPAARSEPSDAAGRKRPREAAADNSEPAVYRSMGAVSAYLKGKQASSGAGE